MSCCPGHQDKQSPHHHLAPNGDDNGQEDHVNHETSHEKGHGGADTAADFLRRFLLVTFLLIPLFLLTKTALSFFNLADFAWRPYLQFGFATVIFYFSLIFFEHARHEIKAKKYGMMTLVSLAVGAGYLFSALSTFLPQLKIEFYLEISTLIWVLLFGHYLEAKSTAAAGDALGEVAKLLPKQAHLMRNGQVKEVTVEELKKGDLVLVKPGEKVPADGVIIKGRASFDESLISGESKPIEKKENDRVVAGSICLDGSLEIKLSRVGEHSTIGQIKQLIAQAQQTKPRAQKIADKAASLLTFTAIFVAILTILIWSVIIGKPFVFALALAITVLVIACPHALGLAIPTVSTIATSLAVKNGLFLKDLGKLEVVKDVDYVVFDKTGTLTKGEFGVTEIINPKSQIPALPAGRPDPKQIQNPNFQNSKLSDDQKDIIKLAVSLESHSSHVIGLSIVRFAQENKLATIKVDKFKNLAGKGITGRVAGKQYWIGNETLMKEKKVWQQPLSRTGKTVVFLANEKEIIGVLALSDQIKPASFAAVDKLHRLGIKVAMLTGDNQEVAEVVARQLKIDTYFAKVLPEDKYKHIKSLQEQGNKVMMIGDGVNDAPSLTQADVGVAVGAGTDVAVEAGDVVLTRNNPQDIVRLTLLAKKVYRKMVENLVWATGYNVLAIPAAAGLFAPWGIFLKPEIGALLMSLSSVLVVINALLLKKVNLEIIAEQKPRRTFFSCLLLISLSLNLFWLGKYFLPKLSQGWPQKTSSLKEIKPVAEYELRVGYLDLGPKMLSLGVINLDKFKQVYERTGQPLTEAELKILTEGSGQRIKINSENAHFLLNYFWALGLANKNKILTAGEMAKYGQNEMAGFASTGGWSLGNRQAMDYYAQADLLSLTEEQQQLVEEVSKNVYRPCCPNPTSFPDCNHGMAMLGLLELMAESGAGERQMYEAAKYFNYFWFRRTYDDLALYFKAKDNQYFQDIDPKLLVSQDFSSFSGWKNTQNWLAQNGLIQPLSKGGASCGV